MSNRKNAESAGLNESNAAEDTLRAETDEASAADGNMNGEVQQNQGAGDNVDELNKKIRELESELSELKDQYLRKQADFENFRKRMTREKEDSIAFANRQLLLDIVTIIDDFERAILSAEESRDFDSFHNGVALIEKQFTGMLERKWGLKRFDAVGEPFDPQKHEALTTEAVDDHEESLVLEDYQKGYLLHDKVLRSAKVKVSVSSAQ